MTTQKIRGAVAVASLPRTPVMIGGRKYDLCFDIFALYRAEASINAAYAQEKLPDRIRLADAFGDWNIENVRTVFAAAVRTFHPELSFDEARRLLLTPGDAWRVVAAIESPSLENMMGWMASMEWIASRLGQA
jgi:hypothetical protein